MPQKKCRSQGELRIYILNLQLKIMHKTIKQVDDTSLFY